MASADPLVDTLSLQPLARRTELHELAAILNRFGGPERVPECLRAFDRNHDVHSGKGGLRRGAAQAQNAVAGEAQLPQRLKQAGAAALAEGGVDPVVQQG